MFHGSMVALVTPMLDSGELDYASLHKLIEFHFHAGTNALVIAGTTGESATLTTSEYESLLAKAIELANGRLPIIAGTGTNSTKTTLARTALAKSLGAAACLIVTPYYNKPTQEGLMIHYQTVAESVDIPIILYNVPSRTGCDLQPATVLKLSRHPNIIGIKEATANQARFRELIRICPETFKIYSGDDATALELILAGGHGVISVTANIAPKQMQAVCDYAFAGELFKARGENELLIALHELLFVESNPIPVKWALSQMGLIENGIRLPLTPLSAQYHERLKDAMVGAKLLSEDTVKE